MYGQAAPLRRERDEKVNRLKSLDALQARMVLLKSQENEKRSALSFYQSSLISSIPSREILRAIRHIVPSNVTVTLLEVPEPARPLRGETKKNPAFEGRELQISGMAFGNNLQCLTALAQLIERLENERLFKNTQLTKAEENKLYNQPGFEFAILCDLDLEKPLREGKAGTHGIKK
jgi:Tfp pilus assembly protein PilN